MINLIGRLTRTGLGTDLWDRVEVLVNSEGVAERTKTPRNQSNPSKTGAKGGKAECAI